MALLKFKKNVFSQNGEDGVVEEIFSRLNINAGVCCEFGAWDGIHLSNTRNLILRGWRALLIEGDKAKFDSLVLNYANMSDRVKCLNTVVDSESAPLDQICSTQGFNCLDFLSIDIDGLDFEIFDGLKIRPKVICVEVNAGHSPTSDVKLDSKISANNIGQPMGAFVTSAEEKGYRLVCYTGNAFFVRSDLVSALSSEELSTQEIYREFLASLTNVEKEWLYLVNLGLVTPFYRYRNPYLSRSNLCLSRFSAAKRALISIGALVKHRLKTAVASTKA